MTLVQLAAFRAILADARQPVHRADSYAFPRGWNEAIDFAERKLKEVLGESDAAPNMDR